ncbi:MAG: histidine kinase [Anaerocolumna sp.]|jgi:signal transduction histidine kinase|nr:histidine kinase [Anaerocolumna sp.]
MKKLKSLNIALAIFVFLNMIISNLLVAILGAFIIHLKMLPDWILTPVILPFIALLASLILGTSLSPIIGKKFIRPIKELIEATRVIAKGDFSVRVQERKQRNALDELKKSFNLMAEELGSIELLRRDFINNFSHEFKTPIVSIRGFAKRLQKNNITEEQRLEYTNIIIHEADRLSKMSANILLLSKLRNQQILNDKNEFFLDEQIRDCILLLEKQWSKKNINLDIQLDEIKYYTNEEMLSHVWINLLSNAIKFSSENSCITITCCKDSESVHVSISDQGIGISKNVINRIFDQFYQVDTSHSVEGNGLGLPLVKSIVELCHGTISVKSEVGAGSTFTVSLPVR